MTRQATKRDTENGIDTLRDELNTLREDVGHLVSTMVDMGRNGAAAARDTTAAEIEKRLAQLEAAYGQARQKGEQAVKTARHTVEEHPLTTVAIAFGVGALIGRLMRRG